MRSALFLLFFFILPAGCDRNAGPVPFSGQAQKERTTETSSGFSFIVISDTPYNRADSRMLDRAVPQILSGNFPFVIHTGDYKNGLDACTHTLDERFSELTGRLEPVPVFYTPGDNEWTDCDRRTSKETGTVYSELDRLERIRELFFSSPPAAFHVQRHPLQPENASWVYKGVRFATLSVSGTSNGRTGVKGDHPATASLEAGIRDHINIAWTGQVFSMASEEKSRAVVLAFHADVTAIAKNTAGIPCTQARQDDRKTCDPYVRLREAIAAGAGMFAGPVLLVHGDTPPFTLDRHHHGKADIWRLNAAGDTPVLFPFSILPGPGVRDVTQVTVSFSGPVPFTAGGLLTGKVPGTSRVTPAVAGSLFSSGKAVSPDGNQGL